MKSIYLDVIRQNNPLVHHITNIVAANYCANGLLALGASPLMSANCKEVAELQQISQALLINIGTLIPSELESMLIAGKEANVLGVPVILDPVGVGATSYRRAAIEKLLAEIQFTVIKGNIAELTYLAGQEWRGKGVDAGNSDGNTVEIARAVAKQFQCIAVISGAIDTVSDGIRSILIHNGSPMFSNITASGCLLGSVCAAFVAVATPKTYFDAVTEACVTYAVSGENGAKKLLPTQYGQFSLVLLDELASITAEQVSSMGRIEYV